MTQFDSRRKSVRNFIYIYIYKEPIPPEKRTFHIKGKFSFPGGNSYGSNKLFRKESLAIASRLKEVHAIVFKGTISQENLDFLKFYLRGKTMSKKSNTIICLFAPDRIQMHAIMILYMV